MLSPAQEVVSYLINSAVGLTSTSRRQFQTSFRDAPRGEPDTLLCICIKWFFKNGDFSDFYEDIKQMVKGKSLAGFVDSHLMVCPEIIRLIVENADNKSRKNKISIKRDEFSICVGRGRLISFPYTEDMEEPAAILAEYTRLLFSFQRYDIEFAFEDHLNSFELDQGPGMIPTLLKPKVDCFRNENIINRFQLISGTEEIPMLSPAQEVVSYLINSAVGLTSTSRRQFQTSFRDAPRGEPDTLLCICIKWFFKNGDFSDFYEDIKQMVKGKSLAGFVDSHLMVCPEIIRLIVENADNKSRKNKISIKRDEFSICVGRGRLISFPYTEDMEEPAAILAEYTRLLFSFQRYDIEFAFEGNFGLNRNMDLGQPQIKLLSKLTPEDFAEKGRVNLRRERVGRLSLRMSRISWNRSGVYFNAIIQFFENLRATVVIQGEHPLCRKKLSYAEVLEHTLAHPGEHLEDDDPLLKVGFTMQKVRKANNEDSFSYEHHWFPNEIVQE
ncbi:Protein CBG16000 [Caenorhabditis briggsae]|uniref:Protein CBG16000 n=2 Tax=Caenorhabditis briggsae TaxID=6238 RepID=A8XNB2_CAEBR|nr:Protein CBG16000 [Caenorhabditis briggsae]CAP34343.2 Protein CBG16000 [Caenorhabditis briggsae]